MDSIRHLFINDAGRLRSGWRLAVFVAALLAAVIALFGTAFILSRAARAAFPDWRPPGGSVYIVRAILMLVAATVVGWACNRFLEGLPWRALGWTQHRGWLRDLSLGALVGALSLALGAAVCTALGSYTFMLTPTQNWPAVAQTLVSSALIFMIAAAMEEALFRGYPLQTLLRSWPAWLALLPTSLYFAYVHLDNPNVASGFTFLNTLLAGVWLALAYLRTRSLWFPLGIHWGWNWAMGSLLGLPVSGISEISPNPILRAADTGPTWLTGGHYGIEGGLACTLALIMSSLYIWRTRLLKPDDELKRMTDDENPAPDSPSLGKQPDTTLEHT